MTTFRHVDPNDPNVDLDAHPAPPGLWSRVAVVGLWSGKERIRKAWPDAAVVGPLRTERGIDLLVRSLLCNPQLRVVILDGPDLRPDVTEKLCNVWSEHGWIPGDTEGSWGAALDDEELVATLIETRLPRNVKLLRLDEWDTSGHGAKGNLLMHVIDEDRPGGAVFLPPPKPANLDVLPHGDPGQRVVGDTLAEVWPRALEQAMRFGRVAETQYGPTREVLALTSVIRDPLASLDEFQATVKSETCRACGGRGSYASEDGMDLPASATACASCDGRGWCPSTAVYEHPVLGFTYADVEAYYKQITTDEKGARDYSYGSRMRGGEPQEQCPHCLGTGRDGGGDDTPRCAWCDGSGFSIRIPDQIAAVQKLLSEKPDTRAAFLTPWQPSLDSGLESGRPCLDGVRFRATGGQHTEPVDRGADGSPGRCAACGFEEGQPPSAREAGLGCSDNPRKLHMFVTFRSHDLYAGHPVNLAGLCMWLVEEGKRLGMLVGALTCTSWSAHVYARDYAAALDVIAKHPAPMISWDQRSSWRIRTKPGPEFARDTCDAVLGPDGNYTRFVDQTHLCGAPATSGFGGADGSTDRVIWVRCEAHAFDKKEIYGKPHPRMPLPRKPVLVAEALTPGEDGGDKVIWTTEAPTPGALRLAISRSGLCTGVGAALWLGGEIERVWSARGER